MLSIHEQIQKWSEAADGLQGEIPQAELDAMTKDIGSHAEELWTYHELIAADAERLSEKAKEYSEAARMQKKKSERVKDYLKFALKSNGFTKAKFGAVRMALSITPKNVEKRPATETDFYAMPEFTTVKFSWTKPPSIQLWEEWPDFVAPEFAWDIAKLEAAGKNELLEPKDIVKLRVTIAKEK